MTTVLTNSRPTSGSSHHQLLSVPPRMPFPTSPSLPDRRARLKRLNLSMTSRESLGSEGSLESQRSKRVSREQSLEREIYRQNMEVSRLNHSNMPEIEHNSSPNQTARRGHRNIVTSRNYKKPGDSLSITSRPPTASRKRRSRSRMAKEKEERNRTAREEQERNKINKERKERVRLPNIALRQTTGSPQPQGFFLTSLAYDESPMPTERRNSASSRNSKGESNNNAANSGDATSSHDSLAVATPRDHLPVLTTSRDNAATSKSLASRNTVGLQRVYLEGLDLMRSHVTNVEEEADRINREFHKVETMSGGDCLLYLKECDERLLQANTELRKRDVKLEVIDSDTRLVKLLNNLRAGKTPDKALVDFLTTFWEELKSASASLQALLDKFNNSVVQRLSHNYISSHSADLQVPVCQQYALDIEGFLKDLDTQLGNANMVLKSYGNSLHKDLIDKSDFAERLMVTCDLKAFPILGFVNDVSGKITRMCETARQWLARDAQFMHEINEFIRETRTVARRREEILQTEKQKQKRVEKNVKIAQSILQNNREKLRLIETELQQLEQKLDKSKEEQKTRTDEIHQKESMVDFLKVTLQQTKKNYSLQTKRTKLLRQVKELEDYLRIMESDLEMVQDQILAKSHEKLILTEKINTSEKSYGALKTDLDRFSENLEDLEAEVTGLSGQLLQLEIVHTIRTSPETLDNLIDRPSTVKLSKSLKERIKERKKKALAAAKSS